MLNLIRCSFHYCSANIGVVISNQRLLESIHVGPAQCAVPVLHIRLCATSTQIGLGGRASMLAAVRRGPASVMDLTYWWSPFIGQCVKGQRIELA